MPGQGFGASQGFGLGRAARYLAMAWCASAFICSLDLPSVEIMAIRRLSGRGVSGVPLMPTSVVNCLTWPTPKSRTPLERDTPGAEFIDCDIQAEPRRRCP